MKAQMRKKHCIVLPTENDRNKALDQQKKEQHSKDVVAGHAMMGYGKIMDNGNPGYGKIKCDGVDKPVNH